MTSNTTRLARYQAQNKNGRLTGPQLKRLARHDIKCDLTDGDKLYGYNDVPAVWEVRYNRMRPVVQHFDRNAMIDNVRKPTGRTGIRRWGIPVSREGLDKLFSRVLVPVTGRETPREDSKHIGALADRLFGGKRRG